MTEPTARAVIETPLGRMRLGCCRKGLCEASFIGPLPGAPEQSVRCVSSDSDDAAGTALIAEACSLLARYFAGELTALADIEICFTCGTAFQQRVWRAMQNIEPGKTKSYSEIATEAGSPKAVRAAGLACGANPVVLFVPCHRVIGKNGALTGFGAGLPRKELLLAHEGAAYKGAARSAAALGPNTNTRARNGLSAIV